MAATNVAVVGAGYMGSLYARVLARASGARLVGLCDALEDKARNLASALGVQCACASNPADIMNLAGLQALVIATPESQHTDITLAALEKGLDVFVEKPLAMTSAECQRIVDAAATSERLVMVGHTTRFDPRFISAASSVKRGEIGDVVHAFARRNNPSSRLIRLGNRVSVAGFLGVHDFDLLLWIIGKPVRSVFARSTRRALTAIGLDDCTISLLTFDDGTLAVVENAWGVPDLQGRPRQVLFELRGTKGIIEIDVTNQGFGIYTPETARFPDMWFRPEVYGQVSGMYRDAMEHFISCVQTRQRPLCDGEAGMAAVRIMEAVDRSLAEQREVFLHD
jgi:predicted dehydrogenase